jgi:hypothetical protein
MILHSHASPNEGKEGKGREEMIEEESSLNEV